jgi:hypothetical protein
VRLLLRIVLVIWCSGVLLGAFAQGPATTRSGFAIVTLVSGNIAGLIATGTLRNRTGSGIQQAVVAPSPLITTASILVRVGPVAEDTTAIAIANPSASAGGVNLALTNSVGRRVANVTVQVGPRGQFSRYLNELLPQQVRSTNPLLLTVSSEIPIAILTLNFRDGDFTTVPLTSLSPTTPVPIQPLTLLPPQTAGGAATTPFFNPPAATLIGGPPSLVFAQVAAGGEWSTDIAIGNTSSATQTIRIDFFASNGVNIGSLANIVIQPLGVFSFSTDPESGEAQ